MIKVVLWIAALFFAGSWTFGLMMRPDFRLKSTVVTIAYWWAAILVVWLSGLHPAHLLWLMPLALVVPMMVMNSMLMSPANTTPTIFVISGIVLVPAGAALL